MHIHPMHIHAHQVKDLLFVLLELYETAKHCIQGGYIVWHVQDESYPAEVRRCVLGFRPPAPLGFARSAVACGA